MNEGPICYKHVFLEGCQSAPIFSYLKALGIFRVIVKQADPKARASWVKGVFRLTTKLSQEEIEHFFLYDYSPLPLMSPWNKGSGLLASEDKGVGPIARSIAPRFENYREAIRQAQKISKELAKADQKVRDIKDRAKLITDRNERDALRADSDYRAELAEAERRFKRRKADILESYRKLWRGPHQNWMDAVLLLDEQGTARYPSLWGTGGNDGRFDFTNNVMQRLADLFQLDSEEGEPKTDALPRLRASLWNAPAPDALMKGGVGQYHPGGAGGANSTTRPQGDSYVNPWDLVFLFEASPLFIGAITRQLQGGAIGQTTTKRRISAPFQVYGQALGYGSASAAEEQRRGEQWMPIWAQPASLKEVGQLMSEGRAQVQGKSADNPTDLARAIANLGIERGLTGFERYGFLERNGQSTLAVPLGRIVVGKKRDEASGLIDEIARWVSRVEFHATRKEAPKSLVQAHKRLSDSIFTLLTRDATPRHWQNTLLAMGEIESLLIPGASPLAGPLPRLSSGWLEQADDNSPEFRLALAFSKGAAEYMTEPPYRVKDPVRNHILNLNDMGRLETHGSALQQQIAPNPRVVSPTVPAIDALSEIVYRRLIETDAAKRTFRLGLGNNEALGAQLPDITKWINGTVDTEYTWRLARVFTAIRKGYYIPRFSYDDKIGSANPPASWSLIRLALLPFDFVPRGQTMEHAIRADGTIVRRLLAGDMSGATRLAHRRLRSAGLQSVSVTPAYQPQLAMRIASSLAFPISSKTAGQIGDQVFNFNPSN